MQNPSWFGRRYAKFQDLEALAQELGIAIGYAPISMGVYFPSILGIPVIVLPSEVGPLKTIWTLAHELGHVMQHSGPKGALLYSKEEHQANRWAACALIPFDRIAAYDNACEDAMIAALSAHYEDLPMKDCPARDLAWEIARIRLSSLSQEVA